MPERIEFVPECHVDTALMWVLLSWRLRFINHQHGISKVATALQRHATTSDTIVVGMVDADKQFDQSIYLREFVELPHEACHVPGGSFQVRQHPTCSTQFLIVLQPACDRWLFQTATAAGLRLSDYGLPPTLTAFLDVTKQRGAENLPELKRLLYAIRQARPAAYEQLAAFLSRQMAQAGQQF